MESMDTERQNHSQTQKPPPAKFDPLRFAFWLPWCFAHGAAVAWIAAHVEQFAAPVLLFSLLVGVVLGATLIGLTRLAHVGHRWTILSGAVLAVSVAVVGQHYINYRIARRQLRDQAERYRLARSAFGDMVLGEMPAPPAGFVDFFRWRAARGFEFLGCDAKGAVAWLIWAADGLLVLAAALAVVVPALKKPYCSRCKSWFNTTRRGPLDADSARQLATLVGAEPPKIEEDTLAGYRLFTCAGGCGPTGFELRYDQSGRRRSSLVAWLDAEQRNRLVAALDQRIADV
jgi:hypothetical protein